MPTTKRKEPLTVPARQELLVTDVATPATVAPSIAPPKLAEPTQLDRIEAMLLRACKRLGC